uniref:Uncharacterized protein n=1 Tax=Anopheles dirus TaxID=7168 RepID=A0A182NLP7_9DIPT
MADENENSCDKFDDVKPDKMFTLKKWNSVAMWSWDVECDTCAICRVQVMGRCREAPRNENRETTAWNREAGMEEDTTDGAGAKNLRNEIEQTPEPDVGWAKTNLLDHITF